MHHPGAEVLDPAGAFADQAALAAADVTADVNLDAWFGELEIRRTETDLTALAEHPVGHELQCALQVGQRDILADDQAFRLHELMGMGRVVIIAAVDFTRADDLDRQLALGLSSSRI